MGSIIFGFNIPVVCMFKYSLISVISCGICFKYIILVWCIINSECNRLPIVTYHTQEFSDSFLICGRFHLRDCFYLLSLGFNAICSKKMAKVVKFLIEKCTLAFLLFKICLFQLSQNNLNVFQVLFSIFTEYYNIIQICKCEIQAIQNFIYQILKICWNLSKAKWYF